MAELASANAAGPAGAGDGSLIGTMTALQGSVADLIATARYGHAAADAAVINQRLAEADLLLLSLDQALHGAEPGPEVRKLRHDLMNALGAMDNFAELIVLEARLPEAGAVREAVRTLVQAVRDASMPTT